MRLHISRRNGIVTSRNMRYKHYYLGCYLLYARKDNLPVCIAKTADCERRYFFASISFSFVFVPLLHSHCFCDIMPITSNFRFDTEAIL